MQVNSKRFLSALKWTAELYANDIRKSSKAPSFHHALGVCEIVMGADGDEDTCIGALFHDLAEDKGGETILSAIRATYGETVERIVRDCSDTIPSDYSLKEPWISRKIAHLDHIRTVQEDSALVLVADTLHNVRDHYANASTIGPKWWENFRANVFLDRELTIPICALSTLWYFSAKTDLLENRLPRQSVLKAELSWTVSSLWCWLLNNSDKSIEMDYNDSYTLHREIQEHIQLEYNKTPHSWLEK